jgi:hypothetical protein
MPTSNSILTALSTAIKGITVANGYVTNLASTNVFTRLESLQNLQAIPAAQYPRVFIISDGASYSDLPANRISKEETFTILAVFAPDRNNVNDVAVATQVSNFVDDFELMIGRNRQLGGADTVKILALATDVHIVETESVAMFELSITYRRSLA